MAVSTEGGTARGAGGRTGTPTLPGSEMQSETRNRLLGCKSHDSCETVSLKTGTGFS